jgi:hypothetical protein
MPQNRKRDVLGDLLTSAEESAYPGVEELNTLIHRPDRPQPKALVRQTKGRRTTAKISPQKVTKKKATHYLSMAAFEGLDQMIPKIKKMVPKELQNKVTKSQLVDSSLKISLEEFQKKGRKSLLMQQLLKEKAND